MNLFEKYEDFFPKDVYRCPRVLPDVKHCFENGEHPLGEILEKEDLLIVCVEHLRMILISKRKFKCTTEDYKNAFVIPIFSTWYCRGCVKKYMRQLFSYFYFVNFDL